MFMQLSFINDNKVLKLLEITRFSHKICMRMANILNVKNCDIKDMFLDDFNNISNFEELKKWKTIRTSTHTVIAYDLINIIKKK